MKRFKKILFVAEQASDLCESAAEKARDLARLNGASIKVVGAVQEGPLELINRKLFGDEKDLNAIMAENLENQFVTTISGPEWEGIPMDVEILSGKLFISVIQKVVHDGFDLVIKQNNEEQGVDSVAARLLRKCPCPIWLIKSEDKKHFRKVLAAVDLSDEDEEKFSLNKKIIELAHSMAQREGGESHYLYSWYLYTESMLRGPRFNWQDDEITKFKRRVVQQGNEEMKKLYDAIHAQPSEDRIHIVEGKTEAVIAQIIEEKDIDILVMGTVGRAGIPGLLIGNTAENVIKSVKCSLMAVKPDGFVSPVS